MKEWSLVMCSLTSSSFIGEHFELLNWQMEVSKSIECIRENPLFHTDISPHFKFLLSNGRLEFSD